MERIFLLTGNFVEPPIPNWLLEVFPFFKSNILLPLSYFSELTTLKI